MKRAAVILLSFSFACGDDGASSTGGTTTGGDDTSSSSATSASTGASSTSTGSAAGGGGEGPGGGGTGGGASMLNGFPAAWPNGTDCAGEDDIFVWELAEDTFILRQSLCTSFEGPFLHLLFGNEKAILFDSGDGGIPVQATVQGIVDTYAASHGLGALEVVVAHSHGHGDHTSGDGQFQNAPNTTVVGTGAAAVQTFFGIDDWPNEIVPYDLGGRVLDIIPIPGHQTAHIAVYDRRHDLLYTGDTLYPGRLYIQDFATYVASTGRLVDFVGAGNNVAFVLGTHIEMTTTPGDDFPFGATQHPNEHALELSVDHLTELNAAVEAMGNNPVLEVHDDFIVYPL
jgi:glyoxylase-like metal-dependent hydrolase (beta-lactamase superfamily II)